MTRKVVISILASSALIAISYFVHAAISPNERPLREHDTTLAAKRSAARNKIAQLRSAFRNTVAKESARDRASRKRFQSIISTVLGDTHAIVADTAGLKSSRLGERAVECLRNTQGTKVDEIKREWGIDLLVDAERLAFAEDFILIDGDVAGAKNGTLFTGGSSRKFGVDGTVLIPQGGTAFGQFHGGLLSGELLVLSPDPDEVHEVIDIAENDAPNEESATGARHSQAMIYGRLPPEDLLDLLGVTGHLAPVSSLLDRVVKEIFFEIFVRGDVLVRAELLLHIKETKGLLLSGLENLRTALIDRSKFYEYHELVELIDSVSMREGEDAIIIEWEMPYAFVEDELKRCSD